MTEPGASAAITATSQGSQGDSRLRQRLIKKYCCKPRKVGSKGAVLVIIWSCLVSGAYYSTVNLTIKGLTDVISIEVPQQVAFLLFAILCPFAGWLADVYFGRYKVMRAGLWLMWVGSIAGVLARIIKLEVSETGNILYYSVMVLAAIVFILGDSAFAVNVVPFGTDQMLDASGEEISAFVHWFVWSYFVGHVATIIADLIPACTHLQGADVLQSLIPVTLLSLALCCDFLLNGWLTIEPVGPNPFKLVLRVLKFTATHKHLIRRSAFTHCEDERPSRIDFAKSKYGGPFTTEEVEDVKTCLRILVVILCISTFLVPSQTYWFSVGKLYTHFVHPSEITQCYGVLILLTYSNSSIIVLSILLYEVLIHRVARRVIPSTMKRIGISIFLVIVLSLITLLIDTAGHLHNHSLPCMFRSNGSSPVIETDYIWVDVFTNIFHGIQFMLYNIALFEFICAQVPYNLKGLVIGVAYSIYYTAISLAYIIDLAWDLSWKETVTQPSCGFWYYLSIVLTATLGLVIWCIVAKWYKRRERDEPAYEHMFVVNYYEKYCGTPSEINA